MPSIPLNHRTKSVSSSSYHHGRAQVLMCFLYGALKIPQEVMCRVHDRMVYKANVRYNMIHETMTHPLRQGFHLVALLPYVVGMITRPYYPSTHFHSDLKASPMTPHLCLSWHEMCGAYSTQQHLCFRGYGGNTTHSNVPPSPSAVSFFRPPFGSPIDLFQTCEPLNLNVHTLFGFGYRPVRVMEMLCVCVVPDPSLIPWCNFPFLQSGHMMRLPR